MIELNITLDGGIVVLMAIALLIGGIGALVSAGLTIWQKIIERRQDRSEGGADD